MKKVNTQFILEQYRSGISSYSKFTTEVGLWESEKHVFSKYLCPTHQILDLGCGTGRTTFPLFRLGFENIIGVDLTPEMIQEAKNLNSNFETTIDFKIGDATNLEFGNDFFDVVIFSFNGLMSIPKYKNRLKAIAEINRVLKKGGFFIFTTHDREALEEFFEFWEEEKVRWDKGLQKPILYEFGDLITTSKNEDREIFIHIPIQSEVIELLATSNFDVLETFFRKDQFHEPDNVLAKSGPCRFWIARK